MDRLVDAEMLVQGPSEIEFKNGLFHCVERYSDRFCIRKIYTPAIYAAALAAGMAAWNKMQLEQGAEIIPIKASG